MKRDRTTLPRGRIKDPLRYSFSQKIEREKKKNGHTNNTSCTLRPSTKRKSRLRVHVPTFPNTSASLKDKVYANSIKFISLVSHLDSIKVAKSIVGLVFVMNVEAQGDFSA
ncbi:hypothetical protein VNO77_13716 [Canavalia gladiata]|uniref:Uncharacterized protein n=1 Tax=Canavalia gladiata TaxID=3824 RepID=A0AAN9LY89_CANGL